MDESSFRRAVEREASSELVALGGERRVYGLCGGDPTPAGVLTAVAGSEAAAAETFERWAATESDPDARAAFEAVAEQERDHFRRARETLAAATGAIPDADAGAAGADDPGAHAGATDVDTPGADAPTSGPPGPLHAYLRGLDDATARVAAGMVGRALASIASYGPIRAWFADRGDDRPAALAADLRGETEEVVEDGLSLLAARCSSDADREAARGAAVYAIRVAHDDHADAVAAADAELGE